MKNKLISVSFIIGKQNYNSMYNQIKTALNDYKTIFSYIIYNINDIEVSEIYTWKVTCLISSCDTYNTLSVDKTINDIIAAIMSDDLSTNIAGYKQPGADILVEVYRPLIIYLAKHFEKNWSQLEYDDSYQLCMIALIELSKKNYYIHKNLLYKSCKNNILQFLKGNKDSPEIFNLDTPIDSPGNNLVIQDTLQSESSTDSIERLEELEAIKDTFNELKEIIIHRIGQERWDKLFGIYGLGGKTNGYSRQELLRLRRFLAKNNIDRKYFQKYWTDEGEKEYGT